MGTYDLDRGLDPAGGARARDGGRRIELGPVSGSPVSGGPVSGSPVSGGPGGEAGLPAAPGFGTHERYERYDLAHARELPLDGRTIFFLFVGSAVCACLIFAAGVFVGRRVERRAAAQVAAPITDPLAVLDELASAEESLTFHHVLSDRRPAARPDAARPSRPGSAAAADAAEPGPSPGASDRPSEPAAPRPANRPPGAAGPGGAPGGAPAGLIGPPVPANLRPRYTLHGPPILARERLDAQPLLKRMREAGYQPKLVEIPPTAPGRQPTYRVQVGDFGAADAAQPIKADLERKFKLIATVVKQ